MLASFAYPIAWRFVGTEQDNQAIIELNATRIEAERYQVFARVANFGSRSMRRGLALEINGKTINQTELDIPADSSVTHVWQVTITGSETAAVLQAALRGQDRLAADDTAAIGMQPAGNLRVALVSDAPGVLQRAIQSIPGAQLTVIPPADYAAEQANADLPGAELSEAYELTIFRGYVPPAWPPGQVLVVDPPREGEAGSGDLLQVETRQEIPADAAVHAPNPSPLVAGVDFSGVRWSRAWQLRRIPGRFCAPASGQRDSPAFIRGGK